MTDQWVKHHLDGDLWRPLARPEDGAAEIAGRVRLRPMCCGA